MLISRGEVLAAAKKLLRTFDSAPEPRRQARSIHSELAHGDGWSLSERAAIDALGLWLQEQPPISELRPRCKRVLAALG
jgi:hypothetical protein